MGRLVLPGVNSSHVLGVVWTTALGPDESRTMRLYVRVEETSVQALRAALYDALCTRDCLLFVYHDGVEYRAEAWSAGWRVEPWVVRSAEEDDAEGSIAVVDVSGRWTSTRWLSLITLRSHLYADVREVVLCASTRTGAPYYLSREAP